MKKMRKNLLLAIGCAFLLPLLTPEMAWAGRWRDNTDAWWQQCNDWCNARPDTCINCSTTTHCGGYEVLRSWRGYGNDTHACGRNDPDLVGDHEAASIDNREACENYCEAMPDCVRCSTLKYCGRGLTRMRSWTGRGKNWHACRRR